MGGGHGRRHQQISINLATMLNVFVQHHKLGEVYHAPFDVLFTEGDYMEPDLLFVRNARLDVLSDRGIEGPPDLIVEIISPSTAERDRGLKLERYRLFGVAEYWVVDPDARSVEIWNLAAGASEPVILTGGDRLTWRPEGAEPTLEIELEELLDRP
jgi:Uma2 family endonuclease